MKTEDWQLIATLYETKNLTQAARRLYMTQPALTKRLRVIEKELGHQVAMRTNKGIEFTPSGEYLARQSLRFLSLMQETVEQLQKIGNVSLTLLRVASPSTFTKYFLANILRAYNDAYPDAQFQVTVDVSSNIPAYIRRGRADCGFIQGDNEHTLNARLYSRDACFAVYHKPITYNDLPGLPLIMHNRNEATNELIFRWWKERYKSIPPNIGMTVTTLDTALEMVTHRFGYSIVFTSFLQELRKDLFLLPLHTPDGAPFCRNTWFLYPDLALEVPNIARFVDFVLALEDKDKVFRAQDAQEAAPVQSGPQPL